MAFFAKLMGWTDDNCPRGPHADLPRHVPYLISCVVPMCQSRRESYCRYIYPCPGRISVADTRTALMQHTTISPLTYTKLSHKFQNLTFPSATAIPGCVDFTKSFNMLMSSGNDSMSGCAESVSLRIASSNMDSRGSRVTGREMKVTRSRFRTRGSW